MRRRANREDSGDRDDTVLVAAACAGDHSAFAELFRRHAPDLLRFVERRSGSAMLADDVVAVTFEKAWLRVCDLVERRVPFRPWVFRLAGNELIDQRRGLDRRRRREELVAAGDQRLADAKVETTQVERDDHLRAAISRLSPTHQEVVSLRWFADLTTKEVADALGVTTGTSAVRSHRALAALRRELADPADVASVADMSAAADPARSTTRTDRGADV